MSPAFVCCICLAIQLSIGQAGHHKPYAISHMCVQGRYLIASWPLVPQMSPAVEMVLCKHRSPKASSDMDVAVIVIVCHPVSFRENVLILNGHNMKK